MQRSLYQNCNLFIVTKNVKTAKLSIRNKTVYPSSRLSQAEKIKQYHKENKQLFGPLLETRKKKLQRESQAKNSKPTRKESPNETVDNKTTYNMKKFIERNIFSNVLFTFQNIKKDMIKDGCFGSCIVIRNIQTQACLNAGNTAQPGYVSEDKILQMKQHQNDYALQYPSVTLILNKTMTEESKATLEKWKQEKIAEMGIEEFNKYYEAQMAVGTKFHNTLKSYFTQPRTQLRIEKEVEGVWNSVGDVLKRISSPKAIESNVVHPVLKYRGVFDAIADYEDKPTLIEWKKSDRPRKSIALTYDNPVQLAAYFGAVCNDLNYKHFNVRDALLVIAYTDGSKAEAYHLTTEKLREHWAQWLIRLEEYMEKYSSESVKILKGGKRLFEEDIEHLQ